MPPPRKRSRLTRHISAFSGFKFYLGYLDISLILNLFQNPVTKKLEGKRIQFIQNNRNGGISEAFPPYVPDDSHDYFESLYKTQVAGAAATLPKRTYSPIHFFTYSPSKRTAFTLAEVLITLGVIGIVAAMTMPSLIANYRKKQVVAQLKKVYSTISQAYEMSKNENGSSGDWIDTSQSINTENVKKYVQTYWLPYFKSLQECSNRGDCSYTYAKAPNGDNALYLTGNNRYTIILSDGTLIAFVPFSWTEEKGTFWGKDQKFYIDLNGAKRPNVLGKDVFLFMIYNDKVTSYCPTKDESTINGNCSKTGNGHCCSTKIMRDGWEIKDDYPW